MAISTPPDPPYAFVVDVRPIDACVVPNCRLSPRKLYGDANEIQFDGDPGAYISTGHGVLQEQYFRRGVNLRPNEDFSFLIPESDAASEFDAYLAASSSDTDFHARIEIAVVSGASAPTVIESSEVKGHTEFFRTVDATTLGTPERYLRHVRLPLPSRSRRVLRLTIRNMGAEKLSLGSPLVMKRVEGRGPRQVLFSVFDAAAFHLMDAAFRGNTGEARSAWLGKLVSEHGVYFPHGQSPSQATASFVARFFGGEYWGHQGWPGMFGTGAIDETFAVSAKSPIAHLAEQGWLTELITSNYLVHPALAPLGFDGGIQTEIFSHVMGLARYTQSWAKDHPRDDAFLLTWNSQTHAPYPPARSAPPAPLPEGLPPAQVNTVVTNGLWKNLLESVDALELQVEALRKAAPEADRIIYLTADHSRGISKKFDSRPYRALDNNFGIGLSHGDANAAEEMNTPFAVIFDEPAGRQSNAPSPRIVDEPTSSFAAWRALEQHYNLSLGLPHTSEFYDPVFSPAERAAAWDDRILLSVGLISSMRAVRGDLAYGFFMPKPTARNVWSLKLPEQPLLFGTPLRKGSIISEELYDLSNDPFEYTNLAERRFDDLLSMRRDVVDFVTSHFDPPNHPRRVYTLVFPEVMTVRIRAPNPFVALVAGIPISTSTPTVVDIHTNVVELVETSAPLGVIEFLATDNGAPFVLTCASSGLPVDMIAPERPRFNLSVALNNCPLTEGRRVAPVGRQVFFSSRPATAADGVVHQTASVTGAGANGIGDGGESLFITSMKRWGYVRDIDRGGK